jgi:hypothetical protein
MINIQDKKVVNKIKKRLSKFIEFKYESYVYGEKNKLLLKKYQNEIKENRYRQNSLFIW